MNLWHFPGGPVVKNLPGDAGATGWIPGQGTKILHAAEQLSLSLQLPSSHASVTSSLRVTTTRLWVKGADETASERNFLSVQPPLWRIE